MSGPDQEYVLTSKGISCLGNAYEVIAYIVQSNPTIESLTLVTYEEGPNWRDLHPAEKSAGIDSLLKGLQQDRCERVLSHLSRQEISADNLLNLARSLRKNRLIGVISKVRLLGGGWAHIPMMDFMCAPSARNLEILASLLSDFGQGRGWLLESGRSYHYYAFQLLSEEAWRVFLGKCLLMSGHTDDRYIGHQLVDGYCVLRLSSGTLKAKVPTVVAELS